MFQSTDQVALRDQVKAVNVTAQAFVCLPRERRYCLLTGVLPCVTTILGMSLVYVLSNPLVLFALANHLA